MLSGFIIVLLLCLLGTATYVIVNLMKKVEIYEDFLFEMLTTSQAILSGIKSVDIRGSFEADDEVGFTFKGIKEMVERLKTFFEEE